jgi:hypothetical protein
MAREPLGSPFDFIFVPAVFELLERQVRNSEMLEGVTVYGLFGYAFLALSFLTLFVKSPGMAGADVDDDQATKNAVEAVGLPQVDPNGWIVYGGIATWVVVAMNAAPRTVADTGDTPVDQRAGGSAHSAVAPGRRSRRRHGPATRPARRASRGSASAATG